jgi:tripartite-type tricarboxylate transporter receptor subunit TctC
MNSIERRRLLGAAAGATLLAAARPGAAQPQKFPSRPLKIIVPVAPGGGVDLLSRAIGNRMSDKLGVPVIIENRPGGNMVIGTDLLSKAAPDGYTIMMASTGHAINPAFNPKLPYDTLKDFVAVNYVAYIPLVLAVHPSVPANSVAELIALARAQPGKLTYGIGSVGAGSHLGGEMLRINSALDIVGVQYKGNGPALNDLLGGQISMFFDVITTSLPHIRAGKLKALAVTSARRSALLPEVPTMIESGLAGFEVSGWYMVIAPVGTPADVVATLNAEINDAIRHPDVGARLSSQGVEWVGGTPAQADAFVRSEMDRWGKFVKASGMKPD